MPECYCREARFRTALIPGHDFLGKVWGPPIGEGAASHILFDLEKAKEIVRLLFVMVDPIRRAYYKPTKAPLV